MSSRTKPQRGSSGIPRFFTGIRHRCNALSVAVGMIAGMLPKDNLLVLACLFVLILIPARIFYGLFSLAVFTLVSIPLSPIFDGLGTLLLELPPIRSMGSALFALPLGPWTMLNNTLVLGSLVCGLALFLPIYHVSLNGFNTAFSGKTGAENVKNTKKQEKHDTRIRDPNASLEVEVLYTIPIEYGSPGFFKSSTDSGRFSKPPKP